MTSPATSPGASADTLAAREEAARDIERRLWQHGLDESLLPAAQAAWRRLEEATAAQERDERHDFVVFVPVADRPQHLADCLGSLLELCRAYGYGGRDESGRFRKLSVLVADDSLDGANLARHRELAARFTAEGLATTCFGPAEQVALLDALGCLGAPELAAVLGNAPRQAFGHKGQAVMRNIACLALNGQAGAGRRVLFWSIDSDQEFRVKVSTPAGERDVCAVNFFYELDRIFSRRDVLLLTGKVVGDPPVSPAVMTGNFLEDIIAFLGEMAEGEPDACRHHQTATRIEGEAAYHDMAELFGFSQKGGSYRYLCPLAGRHGDGECFDHFASRLNAFFYGEHPTRPSRYLHDDALASVQPARTVYAGNYVLRPEALPYFIPFASLRLRMSGPTLGRIVRAELGGRFVSANLPMLHKRTVQDSRRSEFRPGIVAAAKAIDFGDEFERQFYGDVMLFSMERLTAAGYPLAPPPETEVGAVLDAVRTDLLGRYNGKRRAVMERLEALSALLEDPARWWQRAPERRPALEDFRSFIANVARNFGENAASHGRLNDDGAWRHWRERLLQAILGYPADRRAWEALLARRRQGAPAEP